MTVPNGTIYENDHVTLIKDDGIFNDEVALFSDSNFKFKINTYNNGKKKHSRGGFTQLDDGSGDVWTLNNLPVVQMATDGEIILKNNYKSIKDFAYYGSAVELLKATVNDIIMRYPGGLYVCREEITPTVQINGNTYYVVSNEFNIDFWSPVGCTVEDGENPLRVLGASYENYVDASGNSIEIKIYIEGDCPETIIGTFELVGIESFPIYLNAEGEKFLLTDSASEEGRIIIEPKKEFFDDFWKTIDDFERVLLNKKSKPIYKAILENPYIKDGKHYYEYKPFTWPCIINEVPDVSSSIFWGYLNSLLDIAEYYDEYDSDNIWRMLTHESIKNLDYSFKRTSTDEDIDASDLDFSRMKAMLRIHGRVFDDIKRYADGIKCVNNITYDGANNLPDYFLSDVVELGGFEAKSINQLQKTEEIDGVVVDITSEDCFSGISPVSVNEINGEFMRRFALSKDYILSEKGTRRGIQSIMGMFGYRYRDPLNETLDCTGDYTIREYIRVANNFPNYNEMTRLRYYNEGENGNPDTLGNRNNMEGFPVAVVSPYPYKEEMTEDDYYLIPWVNSNENYLDNIYFQEKGGWGKIHEKDINLSITEAKVIKDKYNDFCLDLWGETLPYIMYVNDVDELVSLSNDVIYEGMICYVTDISKVYTTYSAETDYHINVISIDQAEVKDYSHYFILYNTALSTHIGYVNNDLYSCYGWKCIMNYEFNGDEPQTLDGLKVLYLESLSLDTKGNNPHCGYGKYDNGDSYIEKLNHLFGTQVDEGVFDYMKTEYPEDYEAICTSGFSIGDLIEDNRKTYYFYPSETDGHSSEIVFKSTKSAEEVMDSLDYIENYNNFVNPEEHGPHAEQGEFDIAAFSVVNVKNLVIAIRTDNNKPFEDYLRNTVFKYLNEMIPSTAILNYKFLYSKQVIPAQKASAMDRIQTNNGSITDGVVADGVITSDSTTYFVENNIEN